MRNRKRLAGLLVVILLTSFPAVLRGAEEAPGGSAPAVQTEEHPTGAPRIRFLSETENLGDVPQGQPAERVFVFFNDGDAPLRIVEVHSS